MYSNIIIKIGILFKSPIYQIEVRCSVGCAHATVSPLVVCVSFLSVHGSQWRLLWFPIVFPENIISATWQILFLEGLWFCAMLCSWWMWRPKARVGVMKSPYPFAVSTEDTCDGYCLPWKSDYELSTNDFSLQISDLVRCCARDGSADWKRE